MAGKCHGVSLSSHDIWHYNDLLLWAALMDLAIYDDSGMLDSWAKDAFVDADYVQLRHLNYVLN